jgi:hypothetical protein
MNGLLSFGGAVAGALAVMLIILIIASESGEVVVLNTRNDEGIGGKNTRLWVVDQSGNAWLRASSADSAWFRRLTTEPHVKLTRGEETFNATAQPKPEESARINELMAEKYGWADTIVSMVLDRDDAIAIKLRRARRLDPGTAADRGAASELDLPSHGDSYSDDE